MKTLEQIALEIATDIGLWNPEDNRPQLDPAEFARRLVAALGAQEPVATLHDDGYFVLRNVSDTLKYKAQFAGWKMNVFAAPVLPSVPEGWQLVPKQPTPEMLEEGNSGFRSPDSKRHTISSCYRAMLAAAPEDGK